MGTPQTIQIANLGMWDSLILMVMALVVFGPRRLPEIGRQIGKLMYEFRKASNDFKFQMEEELRSAEEADRRKKEEERMKTLAVASPTPQLAAPEPEIPAAAASTIDATVEDATTSAVTAESPYPDESVFPPAIDEPPAAASEETYPRIHPPSTGEQVAAARPNSLTALAQASKGEAAKAKDAATSAEAGLDADAQPSAANAAVAEEAPVELTTADPEQAAHHG